MEQAVICMYVCTYVSLSMRSALGTCVFNYVLYLWCCTVCVSFYHKLVQVKITTYVRKEEHVASTDVRTELEN